MINCAGGSAPCKMSHCIWTQPPCIVPRLYNQFMYRFATVTASPSTKFLAMLLCTRPVWSIMAILGWSASDKRYRKPDAPPFGILGDGHPREGRRLDP